jgi:hypothetical protein
LNDIDVRFRWGYFFNEYLQQSYYWEFVKILQKELIIIVLTYYDQDIVVKVNPSNNPRASSFSSSSTSMAYSPSSTCPTGAAS